ncbi:Uncharacterised protein [Vibrio cholerae]|nr:Uncharacterised protein [Vibrio cholerae]
MAMNIGVIKDTIRIQPENGIKAFFDAFSGEPFFEHNRQGHVASAGKGFHPVLMGHHHLMIRIAVIVIDPKNRPPRAHRLR